MWDISTVFVSGGGGTETARNIFIKTASVHKKKIFPRDFP
jgi:hypothetical protein